MSGSDRLASALPSALDSLDDIRARLSGRPLFVCLDYDGTLTPIVARPELAMLGAEMRQTLARLSHVYPTAVISGRSKADARKAVDLDDIYYAGNHGLEIEGPDGTDLRYEKGAEFIPRLERVHRSLESRLGDIEGILLENKIYSLSVHYRNVGAGQVSRIEGTLDEVLAEEPGLKRREGKKVFEVRPDIDWDKGRAVLWLLEALGDKTAEANVIYIGDDVTDEDAFRAVRDSGRGFGIIVLEEPRETAAAYVLRGVDEVRIFLHDLTEMVQPAP